MADSEENAGPLDSGRNSGSEEAQIPYGPTQSTGGAENPDPNETFVETPTKKEPHSWKKIRQMPAKWIKDNLQNCANCTELRTDLKRVVEQMNTRSKQLQGEIEGSKSSERLRGDFVYFFTTKIYKQLEMESVTEKEGIQLYEKICKTFQDTYQCMVQHLLGSGCLPKKLEGLFQVDVNKDEQEFESLKYTYGMFLSTSGNTGTCSVTAEDPNFPSFEPKLECLREDILQLAWSLATAVPPLVPSCEPQKYSRKEHEIFKECGRRDENNTGYTLSYTRPILYANCLGGSVLVKGEVVMTHSKAEL